MNEQLCCFVNERIHVRKSQRERKKRILDTPNWAWQEALTCGFERWSYLDENTNVYSVALFTMLKNRKTYKNVSKNEQMAVASNVQVNK